MEVEGSRAVNKAEIDTSSPFRSVKEAVILFGDKLLTSEVYGSRLKEMQEDRTTKEYANLTVAELEEAKQSLQKARDESVQVASTLFFLQRELEKTRTELQQLKICESSSKHRRGHYCNARDEELDLDVLEDIKFVEEDLMIAGQIKDVDQVMADNTRDFESRVELRKNKCVRFANPSCVDQVILPDYPIENVLQRQPSLRWKKKKQVTEFFKRIFSRSGRSEVRYA